MGEEEAKAKEKYQIGFFKSLGTGVSEHLKDFRPATVETKEEVNAKKYL